jgi:membrane protein
MAIAQSSSRRLSLWQVILYSALSLVAFRGRSGSAQRRHRRPAPENHRRTAAERSPGIGTSGSTRSIDEPRNLDERSYEPERGRGAETPWQIPWTGWKDILWRTYQQLSEDRLVAVAAGVVFYALLAVFPAITALVSLYGLFTDPGTISQHLSLAAGILPKGGLDIVQDQINRLTSKGNATLGLGFLFGLVVALWSANAGMKALMDALNVVYDEKEKRGFVWLNLISLSLTLAAIVSLLFAIAAVVVLPLLLNYIGLGGMSEMLLQVLRWPALLVLVITGLTVLYRFGPSRTKPRWEWLSVGTVLAAAAWLVASALLSWYLANFANYDATYGSLGAAIGFMMWLWISSIVILFGAELNSEIEHQTASDSTVGDEKPLGARGAAMADTLGEAAE